MKYLIDRISYILQTVIIAPIVVAIGVLVLYAFPLIILDMFLFDGHALDWHKSTVVPFFINLVGF